MRQTFWIIVLVSGVLVGFVGYCAALVDWVIDVKTGVYARHPGEALWETGALVGYTWLGSRFMGRKIKLF